MTYEEQIHSTRDDQILSVIEQISNGMLDYYDWKQDSSEITENEFFEIIELSSIKDPKIYKLVLRNVFKDI